MGNPFEDAISGGQEYISQLKQAMQPQSGLAGLDPVWLAAAQGFLSPTKTGGFGESVANAAGAVQAPLKAIKDQQMSAADKIRATQEASARLWLQQQNMNKSDAGMDELRKAQAEYYKALSSRPNISQLSLEARMIKADEDKLPPIGSLVEANASPEVKAEIAEKRQKIAARKEALHKKMAELHKTDEESSTPQPPEGARIGINPHTGEQGYYIKQGDQMMQWKP